MSSNSQIELAVEMKSPCCGDKVKAALQDINGITSVEINHARQIVIVQGDVIAEKLKDHVQKKTGMLTAVMGLGSLSNRNLGSAVAALDVGSSSVRGVLRMTQTDPETCVIEGSLDGLPESKDLFVSIHESGDLTNGCYSCGSSFGSDKDENNGIISRLKREEDSSASFRCTSSNLKVNEMYGRCIVVHDGNEELIKHCKSIRLACGIIARSSGMFENSKRFCACDGVTIWEEKRKTNDIQVS